MPPALYTVGQSVIVQGVDNQYSTPIYVVNWVAVGDGGWQYVVNGEYGGRANVWESYIIGLA